MNILIYPAPQLRQKAKAVKEIKESFYERTQEMLNLMYEAKGIGLAANQVGWMERVLVKDETGERTGERVFINPVILHQEGETLEEEGCLSLPGVFGKVIRSEKVVVAAYTLNGERLEIKAEDLSARVWQHEIDHLNGTLIIDKMTPASRLANSKRLKELEQAFREETSKVRTR